MTTSGVTIYQPTTTQIIEAAFNILGVAQEGEALTPRMFSDGLRALNMLIVSWNAHPRLWIYQEGTLALVGDQAAYAITDPRPLRITSVRYVNQGIQVPMTEMSRQEYFDQPNLTTSPSIPVSFYFDPQVSEGTLYLWPCPSVSVASQYTLSYTYIRRMDVMTATNQTLDFPQEWIEPVTWNLAKRLMTQYPVNDPNLAIMVRTDADQYYNALMQWDNEPASLYFSPDYQGRPGAS